MLFYLSIAVATSLLAYFARRLESGYRIISFMLYIVVVLIFCHFAGTRAVTVGTDTAGYGYSSYVLASQSSFDYFCYYSQYSAWAPLYKAFLWLVCYFSDGFYWVLFSIQLLTAVPAILACRKICNEQLPIAVFCYALMFYPLSFNMMRQMVSMSILLLSYCFVEKRRPLPFALLVLLSMGFHSSAFLGFLVYPLARLTSNRTFSGIIRILVVGTVSLVIMAFSPMILEMVASWGVYSDYVNGSAVVDGSNLRLFFITAGSTVLLCFLGGLFVYSDYDDDNERLIPLAAIVVFGVACLLISLISLLLYRIAFFYLYYCVLLIPRLCGSVKDRNSRIALTTLAILLVLFWSYDYYVTTLSHEVVPYVLASSPL